MQRITTYRLAAALLAAAAAPVSALAADKSVSPASRAEVSVIGRCERLADGSVRYDWAGVYVQTDFTGGRIAATISCDGASFHNVFVDGRFVRKIKVEGTDPQRVVLADGLGRGTHRLRLQKCTEGEFGVVTLHNFVVDRQSKLTAVKPAGRMIEVVGDSYTCGYGTESDRADDPFELETENCDKAYACIVARYFDADYALVAHSGQGIVRHYGDSVQVSADNMPRRWRQVYDAHGARPYAFDAYTPQLVMINVGTNDFSPTAIPSVEQYVGGYVALIDSIRARYPEAALLCVTPHSASPYLSAALEVLRVKVASLDRVFMANRLDNVVSGSGDLGASWHPNYRGQKKIAMSLIPQVATIMGWEMTGCAVE